MKSKRRKDLISRIDNRITFLIVLLAFTVFIFVSFLWYFSIPVLLAPYTQIVVSWNDLSNNEVGFQVEQALDSGFSNPIVVCNALADTEACSVLLDTLEYSTEYFYRVRAYNDAGNSGYSNSDSVITPPFSDCIPGEIRVCYTGPPATLGVGVCAAGTETCIDTGFSGTVGEYGAWSGVCNGQIIPQAEVCDDTGGLDENCNGNLPTGGSNCGDPICSTHSSCTAPVLTELRVDGVSGNVLTNNLAHTLTVLGTNIDPDASLKIGPQVVPNSLYTVSPAGTSVNLPIGALPGLITQPSVDVTLTNPNSPNSPAESNSLSLVFENPFPTLNTISPSVINNPTLPGYTTLTLTGTGFVPWDYPTGGTDVRVTFPTSSGIGTVLLSDYGFVAYVNPTTLQFPFDYGLPSGAYIFEAVNPTSSGGTFVSNSQTFTLSFSTNPTCSYAGAVTGCPTITSVTPTTVTNYNGQIVVSGTSEASGGLFTSDHVLQLDGGFVTLQTTVTNGGTTLTGIIPTNVAPGSYSISVKNTQNTQMYSNSLPLTVTEEFPVISSIAPNSVNVYTPVSLTVTGTGYYSSSNLVLYDNSGAIVSPSVTGFVSSTQLTFSIVGGISSSGAYSLKVINPGGTESVPVSLTVDSVCGDGYINGIEICDDGDVENGDGCSSTCQIETGYLCSGVPSVCLLHCGNGNIDSGETCGETTLPQCGSGSSCNTLSCQCVADPSPPSNPPSSGGSGGGGSSAPTPACNNGRDDDGDGLIDYGSGPLNDPGCSSRIDTSEVNAPATTPISTPTTNTPQEPPQTPQINNGQDDSDSRFFEDLKALFIKDGEFRLIYWSVVLILSSGILVIAILIMRSLRMRARFIALSANTIPPTS